MFVTICQKKKKKMFLPDKSSLEPFGVEIVVVVVVVIGIITVNCSNSKGGYYSSSSGSSKCNLRAHCMKIMVETGEDPSCSSIEFLVWGLCVCVIVFAWLIQWVAAFVFLPHPVHHEHSQQN